MSLSLKVGLNVSIFKSGKSHLYSGNLLKCKIFSEKAKYSTGHGSYEYDLVVIGGGSGGLACAKEAAQCGKRVAVLDYVSPSTQGTQWGLGGTCVNVGCIPKKLMHHAALLRHSCEDAVKYGWDVSVANQNIDWTTLQASVNRYIKSLNWGHRIQLKHKNVEYLNAKGSFLSSNSIKAEFANGESKILSTAYSVIAVGGRPRIPNEIQGAREFCITSDDVFYLKHPPGKTLVIGGSYVALECAGFLTGLGYETSIMIRSIPLRGFDQQMAKLVVDHIAATGTNVIYRGIPKKVERVNEKLQVSWEIEGKEKREEYSTVLLAVGRDPSTSALQLQNINVNVDSKTGKIIANKSDETSVPSIFAIGDVLHNRPELTPVAIQAGKLLSRRLFANETELMDYDKVPTAVFTPLEYGCVGMSEETALFKFGDDNVEIYHAFYKPLEFAIPERKAEQCYIKAICLSEKPQKVIGLHFIGPNAGEVIQGFAAALRCGLTKSHLQSTIGVHPTCAEEIIKLRITKRSGLDPTVTGC
ncbi:thioredoxin reductase [Chamberlinius hualienensis]